jgi:hypothetical protein
MTEELCVGIHTVSPHSILLSLFSSQICRPDQGREPWWYQAGVVEVNEGKYVDQVGGDLNEL